MSLPLETIRKGWKQDCAWTLHFVNWLIIVNVHINGMYSHVLMPSTDWTIDLPQITLFETFRYNHLGLNLHNQAACFSTAIKTGPEKVHGVLKCCQQFTCSNSLTFTFTLEPFNKAVMQCFFFLHWIHRTLYRATLFLKTSGVVQSLLSQRWRTSICSRLQQGKRS